MEVNDDNIRYDKAVMRKKNISLAELCRHIGQTPQNFNKKLMRNTVSVEEMKEIADVKEIKFEQRFILDEKDIIHITNGM